MSLIFNESKMKKGRFAKSFVLMADGYGIAACEEDDEVPCEDFAETEERKECWVLDIEAEKFTGQEMLFVYIPEMDMATTVLSTYVELD